MIVLIFCEEAVKYKYIYFMYIEKFNVINHLSMRDYIYPLAQKVSY